MIDRGCSKINKDHCEEEETLRGKKITVLCYIIFVLYEYN